MLKDIIILIVVAYGVSLAFLSSSQKTLYRLSYPVRLLSPVTSKVFKVSLMKDNLQCFGNIDYPEPTYLQTFGCLVGFPGMNCNVIWGSRSVYINTVNGSAEFFRVDTIPQEIQAPWFTATGPNGTGLLYSNILATRWYQDDATITKPHMSLRAINSHRNIRHVVDGHAHTGFVDMLDSEAHAYTGVGAGIGAGIGAGSDSGQDEVYSSTTVIHIAAEPIYLCGRATTWQPTTPSTLISTNAEQSTNSVVNVHFRSSYTREADKTATLKKLLLHAILIIALSSRFIVPYALTLVIFVTLVTTSVAMRIYTVVLCLSCGIVLLTPFMFTKRNKELTHIFIAYFKKLPWDKHEKEEIRLMFKDTLPAFQTVYSSALVVCIGSALAYFVYIYCGVTRGHRNTMLQYSVAFALSWCSFCCARYFEDLCRDYLWLGMSAVLYSEVLQGHVNPASRNEVIVCLLVLSYLVKYLFNGLLFPAMQMKRFVHWVLPAYVSGRLPDSVSRVAAAIAADRPFSYFSKRLQRKHSRDSLLLGQRNDVSTIDDKEGKDSLREIGSLADDLAAEGGGGEHKVLLEFDFMGRRGVLLGNDEREQFPVEISIPRTLFPADPSELLLGGGPLQCTVTDLDRNGSVPTDPLACCALLGSLVLHFDYLQESLKYRARPTVRHTVSGGLEVHLVCAAPCAGSDGLGDIRDVLVYVYVLLASSPSNGGYSPIISTSSLGPAALLCEIARFVQTSAAEGGFDCKCLRVCDSPSVTDVQSLPCRVSPRARTDAPLPRCAPIATAPAAKGRTTRRSARAPLNVEVDCPANSQKDPTLTPMSTGAWMEQLFSPQAETGNDGFGRGRGASTAVEHDIVDIYSNFLIVEMKLSVGGFGQQAKVTKGKGMQSHTAPDSLRSAVELFFQSQTSGFGGNSRGGLPEQVSRAVYTATAARLMSSDSDGYQIQLLLAAMQIHIEFHDDDGEVATLICSVPLAIIHHLSMHAAVFSGESEEFRGKLYSIIGTAIMCYALSVRTYANVHHAGCVLNMGLTDS